MDKSPDLPSNERGDAEHMKDSCLQTGNYKDKMFSKVSTPTPRKVVQRNMECDWEEVMQSPRISAITETTAAALTAGIQDLQGKLESISQVIQNATHHKEMVKDLASLAAQKNL